LSSRDAGGEANRGHDDGEDEVVFRVPLERHAGASDQGLLVLHKVLKSLEKHALAEGQVVLLQHPATEHPFRIGIKGRSGPTPRSPS
jgi:hypothetical protein